ncbi:hypothetical protein PC9H_011292 [Pleurotus ostreatus]|uniref:alpha-1,2-Mannosidase n=3 Tax=Pleurotus TaxID=5320 RepID=A0A8H6ZIG5_PLEOS|nr:uncharacterized protein PC9H_011292 [Pleurotus ostreatus]KAF7420774.1 hypothetical protein PC9H_011292 [Pleurotus ostreatus]KAG9217989.1 hypothetical protein CCMSSC00406_0009809 [Pleurotus cornucopiae]KAJ8690177.1 hypothetical protein PTI98_011631 [Pleurotus ostreatus]
MLPLHTHDDSKAFTRRWLGRPLARWIVLGLVLITGLWLLAPVNLAFVSPLQDVPSTTTLRPPILDESLLWNQRAAHVRESYLHGYNEYLKYASGHDEVLPLSKGWKDNFNGWGVSMIDSMDTMWIMGLRDEFDNAVRVASQQNFTTVSSTYAPFFETVIRYLGGLLSAHALSGEAILLDRANDLGNRMLPVFDTPSGLPRFSVNTATGQTALGWTGNAVLFSEATSCQVEYKYLAHVTGRSEYYDKVENIMDKMYHANVSDGLFTTRWDAADASPMNNHFSVGASADSGYEYLLKQYLISGKTEPRAKDQYLASTNGIINKLLYISPHRKLLYVTDVASGRPIYDLQHLSCFLPGLFALGVHALDLSPRDKELHTWVAQGLAYTCWLTYADQATGLGPDGVQFDEQSRLWVDALAEWERGGREGGAPPGVSEVPEEHAADKRDYRVSSSVYLLRPETVESLFLMWKTTRDVRWRERGWAIYEALEKHTRVEHGYAIIRNVDQVPAETSDDMPSFFLAETLKYLYLLFAETDIIPLDKWVFNTEAHPLPIFTWSPTEQEQHNAMS